MVIIIITYIIDSLDSFPFERTGNEAKHALALTFGSDPKLESGNETSGASKFGSELGILQVRVCSNILEYCVC